MIILKFVFMKFKSHIYGLIKKFRIARSNGSTFNQIMKLARRIIQVYQI